MKRRSMGEMGRTKTIHKDLPPRMVARVMARGRRLFYYKAGKRFIPLGDNLNLARMKWAEIEANQAAGVHTFKAIAERFRTEHVARKAAKTQIEYNAQLDRLISVFGKASLSDIRPMHIARYLDTRSAKTMANREIALLSKLWNKARGWGYVEGENPCRGIERHKEQPRGVYVSDAEFHAVLDKADAPLRDAMLLAYYTGQRLADVLKMTRSDLRDGALWVVQGKTGAKVTITLEGELAVAIDAMLARKRAATGLYLVQTDTGRKLTYTMLRKRFDAAREKAAVSFQFRDIRPKAAMDSGSLAEAQALLGHQSSSTTKRHYRHVERVKPVGKK